MSCAIAGSAERSRERTFAVATPEPSKLPPRAHADVGVGVAVGVADARADALSDRTIGS